VLNKYKTFLALTFATLLLATFVLPVFAVTYNPGVTTGQYVKYGNFVGTGPGFESFNDYGSLTLTVTSVSGKDVSLLSTGDFTNGTATPGNGTISVWNVETGTKDGVPSTQGPIIASNLSAGNAIPPPNTYTINSTESRTYLGVTRTVNILDVSISTPEYNSTLTYIYDKTSGMLLESNSQTTAQSDSGPVTSEYSYSITETNIFNSTPTNSVPENPTEYIAILAIAIIVVAVVAVLVLFRKKL
jgi:hypothetical protein